MRLLLFVSIVFLTACQSWHTPSENSPYYAIPVGSRLILNQALAIPAETASLYIQQGEIVPYSTRDTYHANCKFEVNTVKQVSQTIEPDEFVVRRVSQYIEVGGFFAPGTMLADANGDQGSAKLYSRIFHLESSKQPDVRQISCGRWFDIAVSNHLTIQEIRDILGDLFTLQLSAAG